MQATVVNSDKYPHKRNRALSISEEVTMQMHKTMTRLFQSTGEY